jgi:elongation factor Tu
MFEMPVESIFHIPGQGTVLAGHIRSGQVKVGDKVDVCSPLKSASLQVAGLERIGVREMLGSAQNGDEVGVLVRGLSLEQVEDGVKRVEPLVWQVVSLTLRGTPRPWWKLW